MKKLIFTILILESFCAHAEIIKPVKNLILLIGDGMGPQQISLAQIYLNHAKKSPFVRKGLHMTNSDMVALSFTTPHGNLVTDSACSATQLATGKQAMSEMIGVDKKGRSAKTILEMAKQAGKSTGLVSDTRITHATPASFASHVPNRHLENEIAKQLATSDVDVMFSGGVRHFLPSETNNPQSAAYKKLRKIIPAHIGLKSKRTDSLNLLDLATKKGKSLVFDRQSLRDTKARKVLGLFTNSAIPNAISMKELSKNPSRAIPNLQEMTHKALEILSKNPKGFFLMVEGGQIDWAGHAGDAGAMLHEMLQFDETIKIVIDWAKNRDDTLVIATADHETGSFGFSYHNANIPKPSPFPGKEFKDIKFKPTMNYGNYNILDKLYAQKGDLFSVSKKFGKLSANKQNGESLCQMVNQITPFKLQKIECQKVIDDYNRPRSVDGPNLHSHTLGYNRDYSNKVHQFTNLISGVLATKQNVAWGTGTHTATPVSVLSWGPKSWTSQYTGFMHHVFLGQLMQKSLGVKEKTTLY